LITQCLQRDFIQPVEPNEPLPNKLHVGRVESQRLMGHDPQTGPIAQILQWAHQQPDSQLDVIHIRDWHDDTDPHQEDHLEMFGNHCIAGSPGAALVLGFDIETRNQPNIHFINSTALNDFEGTELGDLLRKICDRVGDEPVRVGTIGVWTEAKVSFLLYDLKTRCCIDELATCSALTASNSRSQHFNALEQLRKILGVSVFDSTGEFAEWLLPESGLKAPELPEKAFETKLKFRDPQYSIEKADREILGYLYSDSSEVMLDSLSGGYSGALVFRGDSRDAIGHEHAPSVVKIGPRNEIGTERAAFEKIEAILGNNAPRIMNFADFSSRAGIKYSYAAMGKGKISTFKSLYESGVDQGRIDEVILEVFGIILEPFYAAATYERLPLLEHYTFSPDYVDRARKKVARFYPDQANDHFITLPDGTETLNVADFYSGYVAENLGHFGDFHYVSYVHGDLNAANILIDGRSNIWVIDFFHTSRGHVLKDLLKLQNDLLYILTPVNDEQDLTEALLISRAIASINDLREPLPETLDGLKSEQFLRAWSTLRTIYAIGAELCREDRNPKQIHIGLLRYAMHTQSFIESNELQKQWALASACLYTERLSISEKRNRALRIDWIDSKVIRVSGRLGMTICPGRTDHNRDLVEDMGALKEAGVDTIYGLLTERDLEWAGVPNIKQVAEQLDIDYKRFPIPDQGVPSLDEAAVVIRTIIDDLKSGQSIVLHCVGGLGRTGTIGACVAIDRGLEPHVAIQLIRDTRSQRSIESSAQEHFVLNFNTHD